MVTRRLKIKAEKIKEREKYITSIRLNIKFWDKK